MRVHKNGCSPIHWREESPLDELLPEVIAIEKGSVTPIKTEEFKRQLKNRIEPKRCD